MSVGKRQGHTCGARVSRRGGPGGWGKRPPAKPAIEVTTDSGSQNRAIAELGEPVSTSGSGCEPYREIIERDLSRGPQWDGDLAGPGVGSRLRQELPVG